MEKFAERIKKLRLSKNLTQIDVALGTRSTQASVARWEAGTSIPSIEVAVKLAKFFKVSTDYLLGLED